MAGRTHRVWHAASGFMGRVKNGNFTSQPAPRVERQIGRVGVPGGWPGERRVMRCPACNGEVEMNIHDAEYWQVVIQVVGLFARWGHGATAAPLRWW